MSKTIKRTIATALFFCSLTGYSQKRSVDLELIFDDPAPESLFKSGEEIKISCGIRNNGPDNLLKGDTVVFFTKTFSQVTSADMVILEKDLLNGATGQIFNLSISLSHNEDTTGMVFLCMEVLSDPSTQVKFGEQYVAISYSDPETENNEICNGIFLEPEPTAIPSLSINRNTLSLYPNPASTLLQVKPANMSSLSNILYIRDMTGRVLVCQLLKETDFHNGVSLPLDVSTLENGLYFVELSDGNTQVVSTLTIQR